MVHACELHVSESYLASFSTMNELYTTHRHMHIMDSYIKLHIDLQRGGEREREREREIREICHYVTMPHQNDPFSFGLGWRAIVVFSFSSRR